MLRFFRLPFGFAALVLLFCSAAAPLRAVGAGLDLVDGDRVVLLGNTFIERDQVYGHLETLLITRYPDRNLTFRNLGWSGDTVWGHSRAGFGNVEEGYKELKARLAESKPTVVLVGYGMNESFEGEAGLANFQKGLDRLLNDVAATKARIVILGPNYHEDLGRPLPDPAAHNAQLKRYCDLLKRVAAERKLPYVDLYDSLGQLTRPSDKLFLTENGIHLNSRGYQEAAREIAEQLGVESPEWQLNLSADKSTPAIEPVGATVSEVKLSPTGGKLLVKDAALPIGFGKSRVVKIAGLAAGNYTLSIDGRAVAKGTAADWAKGVPVTSGPEFDQTEKLRQRVLDKNSLFFYRWRPQNWTYLFGFRKHEQGNNAKEIPEFDPLVAAKEAEIATLRVPVAHTYEIQPSK